MSRSRVKFTPDETERSRRVQLNLVEWLTNSMKQNLSWKAKIPSGRQELPTVYGNRMFILNRMVAWFLWNSYALNIFKNAILTCHCCFQIYSTLIKIKAMSSLRFSWQWRFKSWSTELWCHILKSWSPATALHCVRTLKVTIWSDECISALCNFPRLYGTFELHFRAKLHTDLSFYLIHH